MPDDSFPEGLSHPHLRAPAPIARHASPLSLLLLGTILAAAMAGSFGGGRTPVHRVDEAAASLEVTMPTVLRNGEFFETVVVMTPKRAVGDLTLGVEPGLWTDLTQNSMVPAAGEESFSDGSFRFSYGPAEAGQAVEIKMDFQINPDLLGGTQGAVTVFDGEEALARLRLAIEVRP